MTKITGFSVAGCDIIGSGTLGSYLYQERTDDFYDANGFACDSGAPVNLTGFAFETKFDILLLCVKCNTTSFPGPLYRWQLQLYWNDYTLDTLKNIGWIHWISDPTCDPIVFSSLSDTVICSDSATAQSLCFGSGGTEEPLTDYTVCEGSSLTVDISE